MKPIPLTLFALAALIAVLLLLRQRWHTLAPRSRIWMLGGAVSAIALFVFGYGKRWVTISDRINCAFYWAAIGGYLLLLAIHSLNRPRWLTSITAVILAAPILASSIFLPLTGIFQPSPRRFMSLGHNLFVSWQRFIETGTSSSGADIDISYRPPWLPFMQHSRLGGRFYDRRCNTAATDVALEPDHNSVFVRCPPWPNSGETDPGAIIRLH